MDEIAKFHPCPQGLWMKLQNFIHEGCAKTHPSFMFGICQKMRGDFCRMQEFTAEGRVRQHPLLFFH